MISFLVGSAAAAAESNPSCGTTPDRPDEVEGANEQRRRELKPPFNRLRSRRWRRRRRPRFRDNVLLEKWQFGKPKIFTIFLSPGPSED